MILNERQYRITNAQADRVREQLEQRSTTPPAKGEDRRRWTLEIDGLRGQLADLKTELAAYDLLKGKKQLEGRGEELGELLVQARIARGWTQQELGARAGLQMQKIQQYEASLYANASATRIREIFQVLGAKVEVRVRLVDLPDLAAFKRKAVARS